MTEHSLLTGSCIKRKIECENEKAEAKRKAEVMLAYSEGKAIQYATLSGMTAWEDASCPSWEWESFDYRVKPGRMRAYVVQWNSGEASFYDKDPGTVIGNLHLRKGAFCQPVWKGWMVSDEGEDV